MQAQTTRWLHQEHHFNRGILIALAGIGLLVASLVGIQMLSDGQSASKTQDLSPAVVPAQDTPLRSDGWTDPYVEQGAAGYPGTTAGLNSTTLSRAANSAIGFTAEGLDITTLNLDQNGADVFTTGKASESSYARLDRAAAIEDGMGFTEERSAGDTAPRSTSEIQFFEDNVWDYAPRAQPAGNAEAPKSAADYRFIEENTWGGSPALPPAGELGQLDY